MEIFACFAWNIWKERNNLIFNSIVALGHGHMVPGNHGACFSKKLKRGFQSFKKFETNFFDVHNNEIY
jgi:hypothetical protein